MSDTPDTPRRYSEDEIERILARAAELEAERTPSSGDPGGMTLAELEQIGSEAGLRPELLRRAARELERGDARHSVDAAPLLGAPTTIRLEREVEGELDTGGLEALVPEIRRAAEGSGHPAIMGSTLSWESTDAEQMRSLGVTVTSADGRTRIWIEESLSRRASSLFGGIVGGFGGGVGFGVGVGVGVGALGSAAFAVAFPAALLTGSFLVARGIFRRGYEARLDALSRLMERMLAEVERSRPRVEGGDGSGRVLPEEADGRG